jgi:hypothetical protein
MDESTPLGLVIEPAFAARIVVGNKAEGIALLLDVGVPPAIGLYLFNLYGAVEVGPAPG